MKCSDFPNGFQSFSKFGNHMKYCYPKLTIRTTEIYNTKLKHINITTVDDNKNDASNNIIVEDNNVIIEDNNHDVSKKMIPSKLIYLYQQELIKTYTDRSSIFKTRNISIENSNDKLDCVDYLELSNLGNLLNLSKTEGDLMLQTFNNISKRHNNTSFTLPKCWSTISRSVFDRQLDQKRENLYKIEKIETLFDDKLFDANLKTEPFI